MHCNVRPPDAALILIRFNYDAHAKFEVAQPIDCCLIAFLLLTPYPRCDLDFDLDLDLDLDLKHL